MTEKRLYHRMKISIPVSFEIGPDNRLIISSTLDISATGLSFQMKEAVQIGEVLKISLGVDETKIVKVDAKVVWVKEIKSVESLEYMVGVKVVDRMDQDEIEFVKFVAKKMFDYFRPENDALNQG